jgi:hypothetical protein
MEEPTTANTNAINSDIEMTSDDDQSNDQERRDNNNNADEGGQRAAAIAEVSALPDIEPTNTNPNLPIRNSNRGGTRANEAAEEAMQGGDLQNVDGPGAEVQAMFIEFLFGL